MKKPLIALVVCSLLITNVSSVFSVPQKANAADVNPPGPGPQTTMVKFTSEKQNEVFVQVGGSTTKYVFANRGQIDTYGQSPDDALKALKAVIPSKNADEIKNAPAPSGYFRYNLSTNSKIFLIIAWKTSVGFIFGGIYKIPSGIVGGFGAGGAEFITPDQDESDIPIAKTVNINSYLKPVNIDADVTSLCSSLTTLWKSTRSDIALLLSKDPKDNPQYWEKIDPASATVGAIIDIDQAVGKFLGLGGWIVSSQSEQFQKKLGLYNKGYKLNSAGLEVAQRVAQNVNELTAITNSVKTTDNKWPSACKKPQKMDADFNFVAGEFIEKPSEFLNVLTIMYDLFKVAIAGNTGVPASTGGEDSCGSFLTFQSGGIFYVLLCELGRMTHAAASWSMGKAVGYLKDTIGIEVDYKLKPPAEDKSAGQSSDSSGTTGTTPGTTAPTTETPGGTTATTGSPMDITVEIQFTSQTAYDTANDGINKGHHAYVKKAGGSDPIIISGVSILQKNAAAKTIKMNFKTTTNIPSDWTSVVIYGKATEAATTNIYRIEFGPYPATGEVKATSS